MRPRFRASLGEIPLDFGDRTQKMASGLFGLKRAVFEESQLEKKLSRRQKEF